MKQDVGTFPRAALPTLLWQLPFQFKIGDEESEWADGGDPTYVCVSLCVHSHIHAWVCVWVWACVHLDMSPCAHTHVQMHVSVYKCKSMCVYILTHVYECDSMCIYLFAFTHTYVLVGCVKGCVHTRHTDRFWGKQEAGRKCVERRFGMGWGAAGKALSWCLDDVTIFKGKQDQVSLLVADFPGEDSVLWLWANLPMTVLLTTEHRNFNNQYLRDKSAILFSFCFNIFWIKFNRLLDLKWNGERKND